VADDATKRRARLGAELRRARDDAGMTQARVASALGCVQGKINKIETTQCAVSPKDLARLLAIYEVPEDRRTTIQLLAAHAGPGVRAGSRSNAAYLQLRMLEGDATLIRALHSERIPGLLQSEHYMLRQYESAGDTTDVSSLLLDRRERVGLLSAARAPRYQAILSESSLHRMPGGRRPTLVEDQAQHLLNVIDEFEKVSIQILTYEAKIPYLDPDFTVLEFDGSRPGAHKDTVYVEYATEGRVATGARLVADRVKYWNRLHQAALSPEDSKKYLHDLVLAARRETVGLA
jgi:transcriptional regulator with XRE-family HTH domain